MFKLSTMLICVVSMASTASIHAEESTDQNLATAPVITFDRLLDEMCDADALSRYPEPAYRQMQASSYNRQSVSRDQPEQDTRGWFADSDGVSWIREEINSGRKEWVIMEHDGPGCLTKFWTPFFYYGFGNRVGPRIRIYLDGLAVPVIDETFIELLTRNDWPDDYGLRPKQNNSLQVPPPFAGFTARAGNLYLPIPFAKNCKVTLDSKPFYHIVNYRTYPPNTTVRSFSMDQYDHAKARLAQTGHALLQPADLDSTKPSMSHTRSLPQGQTLNINLPNGPAAVSCLVVQLDPDQVRTSPALLRSTVLTATFDGEQTIWCPLGDFFGSPNAINAFHTWTRTVTANGRMISRWVMPYRENAQITLKNLGASPVKMKLTVQTTSRTWDARSMHFHACWRSDDVLQGHKFADWNFVDIRGKGVFVGDQWSVLNLTRGWWGEGDEKIYVDNAYDERRFPDHFGTGTEDYYGWAGGVNPTKQDKFNHPYLANISVGSTAHNSTLGFNICNRIRSLDAIPFNTRLRFDMETSPGTGQRNTWDLLGYSAVAWWYALPGTTSNRPALPDDAIKPLMALETLQQRSNELRPNRQKTKQIKDAIEFEGLKPNAASPGVNIHAQTPAPNFKPQQLSGGQHLFLPFRKAGEFAEFRITEQFKPQRLKIRLSKCYDFGVIRLSINGRTIVEEMDLHSGNLTLETVDAGIVKPIDNAITIRVEMVKINPRSRGAKTFAGLDCLILVEAKPHTEP